MKSGLRDPGINDELSRNTTSERIREENVIRIPRAKFLKDTTSEERKKDASKPIYLVRYE